MPVHIESSEQESPYTRSYQPTTYNCSNILNRP